MSKEDCQCSPLFIISLSYIPPAPRTRFRNFGRPGRSVFFVYQDVDWLLAVAVQECQMLVIRCRMKDLVQLEHRLLQSICFDEDQGILCQMEFSVFVVHVRHGMEVVRPQRFPVDRFHIVSGSAKRTIDNIVSDGVRLLHPLQGNLSHIRAHIGGQHRIVFELSSAGYAVHHRSPPEVANVWRMLRPVFPVSCFIVPSDLLYVQSEFF